MRIFIQNLVNDKYTTGLKNIFKLGISLFYFGRLNIHKEHKAIFNLEWSIGEFARFFNCNLNFGVGDNDDGIMLHIALPWIFSLFISFYGVYKCEPCQLGISIHDSSIKINTLSWTEKYINKSPWYRKGFSWSFPWSYCFYKREILDHDTRKSVFVENKRNLDNNNDTDKIHYIVKKQRKWYPFLYITKNKEIQNRIVFVYIDRMTWRMKWYPILPFKKVKTYINLSFNEEVGEGVNTWKGGIISSSHEIFPNERVRDCLNKIEEGVI